MIWPSAQHLMPLVHNFGSREVTSSKGAWPRAVVSLAIFVSLFAFTLTLLVGIFILRRTHAELFHRYNGNDGLESGVSSWPPPMGTAAAGRTGASDGMRARIITGAGDASVFTVAGASGATATESAAGPISTPSAENIGGFWRDSDSVSISTFSSAGEESEHSSTLTRVLSWGRLGRKKNRRTSKSSHRSTTVVWDEEPCATPYRGPQPFPSLLADQEFDLQRQQHENIFDCTSGLEFAPVTFSHVAWRALYELPQHGYLLPLYSSAYSPPTSSPHSPPISSTSSTFSSASTSGGFPHFRLATIEERPPEGVTPPRLRTPLPRLRTPPPTATTMAMHERRERRPRAASSLPSFEESSICMRSLSEETERR